MLSFHVPAWVTGLPSWIWVLGAFAIATGVTFMVAGLNTFIASRLARFGRTTSLRLVMRRTRSSGAFLIGDLVFLALIPAMGLRSDTATSLARVCIVLAIFALGVAAFRVCDLSFDIYARRHSGSAEDVQVRRRKTRFNLLRRLSLGGVVIATVAISLMATPTLRTIGVSLFASAGVAGIAVGLAARPAISNVLAGIQIAFTEPIRIGDQVVLEGEWGTIEDITTTYVVVGVWDQRRLILPISYFLEKPFQNWTRENPQILGTSMFYVDYSVPVEEMREKLHAILKDSKHWDGRAWALQVTDLRERTMEIRALMSARNAGSAFDLRCEVREKMIAYLKESHPGGLPRMRMEFEPRSGFEQMADARSANGGNGMDDAEPRRTQ